MSNGARAYFQHSAAYGRQPPLPSRSEPLGCRVLRFHPNGLGPFQTDLAATLLKSAPESSGSTWRLLYRRAAAGARERIRSGSRPRWHSLEISFYDGRRQFHQIDYRHPTDDEELGASRIDVEYAPGPLDQRLQRSGAGAVGCKEHYGRFRPGVFARVFGGFQGDHVGVALRR